MPLLGGACKFAAAAPAPVLEPRFTGDPFLVQDYSYPRPPNPIAGIELDADGAIEGFTKDGNQGDIGRWDNGLGTLNKADYQFRIDTTSGNLDVNSDPADVWLPASAALDAFWVEVQSGFRENFQGILRVRLAVSPFTEFDTCSVILLSESTP